MKHSLTVWLGCDNVIQFEDRVSRSRSKHEGESSASLCDRLSRTRVQSQRLLPTDHDYAVTTREYQLDQSSPLPATAAADLVLEVQRQKQPQRSADIDRSRHIREVSAVIAPKSKTSPHLSKFLNVSASRYTLAMTLLEPRWDQLKRSDRSSKITWREQ